MLNSQETRILWKRPMIGWNQEKSFQQYGKILLKQERWVINIHEHKDIAIPYDNSLLFTESIQNTTQIFPR